MLIECPFCHTRARLSADKEGAKVRCSECGKVYRARDVTAAARGPKKSNSSLAVVFGVLVVLAMGALILMRSGGDSGDDVSKVNAAPPAVAEEEPDEPEELVDFTGWQSAPVQAAVKVHALAAAGDRDGVEELLALSRLKRDGELPGDDADWSALDLVQRKEVVDAALEALLDAGETGTVAGWTPYDGEVVEEEGGFAVVHLSATPAGGGATKRTVEWKLAEIRGEWRAFDFAEWLTPAEKRRQERGYDVVELSDGTRVREREPEPLEHYEDTPEELRDRIDELMATMLDLELTVQGSRAQRELIEIGKPAIPLLLTHLYENRLQGHEDSVRANLTINALRTMTGKHFGYQPRASVGGALGTTEERRQSSVRQWFAWWYGAEDTFTGPPPPEEEEE